MNKNEPEKVPEKVLESNNTGVVDTWGSIMKDLYKLGVDTKDDAIIKQAVIGKTILDDQKRLKEWGSKMKLGGGD